jgi:ATP-binding cassette subfamily B (MDR/TAP) protein 8
LTFAHITLVAAFGEKVAQRLRAKLFAAIIQQDMSFFDRHQSGELVGRLTTDVAEFKVMMTRERGGGDSSMGWICPDILTI